MNPIPSRLRIICRSAQHDIHTYAQSHMLLLLCTKLSSIEGCLPSKVVFHQRSSSLKGCLLSKVVIRQGSSSIKGCLPAKVLFYKRSTFSMLQNVLECAHTLKTSLVANCHMQKKTLICYFSIDLSKNVDDNNACILLT